MTRLRGEIPAIKDLVRQNAHKSPDAPAFEDAHEAVTWGEIDRRARKAANAFAEYAVQGDRVGFICDASITQVSLLFGAMKAGCVVTNFHTLSAPGMLRYCVRETAPKVLVVDEEFAGRVDELRGEADGSVAEVVVIGEPAHDDEVSDDAFLDGADETEPDVLLEEDDLAWIWWTSGSTGRPKGWCHTNRSLYLKGMKGAARYGVDRDGTKLNALSPSFGAWANIVLEATVGCESIYLLREWDPDRWLELVEEKRITHTGMVATMWREMLERDLDAHDLSSLRTIYSTGEKLDMATLEGLREHVCDRVVQTYGSTETYITVIYDHEMDERRVESVGKPLTGTEVRVVDPEGTVDDELPANEVGEIVVKAPDIPAWVWRDSEKTQAAFEEGWWRSGDLGYRDEDGYLYIEGRVDFQIKSKGVKIMPAPIEEALNGHPDVERAVVVGVEDEEYGEMVTALVKAARDGLTEGELDEWVQESDLVARHERPRAYHFVEEVERTSSGKLDRRATMEKLGL